MNQTLDAHLKAAELLIGERDTLTLDDVRGHAAAECLDERALIALVFGYDGAFYPKRVKRDDGLLIRCCSLAAEAAGITVQLEVTRG